MVMRLDIELAELLARIKAHQFDSETATKTFKDRLTQEQGWPEDLAARAITEYRRFAFIAAAAGHPVAPSDAVDQVWHLHLLYTQNYWDKFCKEVLRRPLHHMPANGEAHERTHLTDSYAATLASYRRFFGEPPADIWPAPAKLEQRKSRRPVDVADNLVLPRRAIASIVTVGAVFLVVVMFALIYWRN